MDVTIFVMVVLSVVALVTGWVMRDFWIAINPGKVFDGLFGDFVAVPSSNFISLEEHIKTVAEVDARLNEALLELGRLQNLDLSARFDKVVEEIQATEKSLAPKKEKAPRKSRSKAVGKIQSAEVEAVKKEEVPNEDSGPVAE